VVAESRLFRGGAEPAADLQLLVVVVVVGVGAGVEASLVDCGRASGVGDTVASRTMGMDAAMPCGLVLQPLSAVGNQKDYYHLWKIKMDHYHLVGNRNGYLSQWEIKIIINQRKIKMDNYHTLWEIKMDNSQTWNSKWAIITLN